MILFDYIFFHHLIDIQLWFRAEYELRVNIKDLSSFLSVNILVLLQNK